MKPQVLLLYIDSSAKLGILPYLSAIFSSHLDFDSIQIDQLNPEVITKYQLVLFSSALCESRVNEIIKEKGICSKQCVRELNYTHIHKILEIPSLSKVCIVSDRKKNCEAVLKSLQDLGFTQYIYTAFSLLIKILRKAFALLCTVIMKPDFFCLVKESTV